MRAREEAGAREDADARQEATAARRRRGGGSWPGSRARAFTFVHARELLVWPGLVPAKRLAPRA
jgi:hypothetical protein